MKAGVRARLFFVWGSRKPSVERYGQGKPLDFESALLSHGGTPPVFTWYQSDAITVLDATEPVGNVRVGHVLQKEYAVVSDAEAPAGITISVVEDLDSDAEDVVTLCETSGGSFSSTLTTAAVAADEPVSIFVRVTPTSEQTPAFGKTFTLLAEVNAASSLLMFWRFEDAPPTFDDEGSKGYHLTVEEYEDLEEG